MYYYGARYYDPRISIFISVDPLAEQTMTPYQYVYNNPINMIDPDGRSGIATINKKDNSITITSMMYFYGNGSNATLAKNTAANIQQKWNDGKGSIVIDGVKYSVNFVVTGKHITEAEAISMAKSNGNNAENNFVRIEDGSDLNFKFSFYDTPGNSGYFINSELANGSTDAHEYGHGLGWFQAGEVDGGRHDANIENGIPGIMTPRGVPVSDEYGYGGQQAGQKTMSPYRRNVLSSDIDNLNINVDELKKNGKVNVGTATNRIYNANGEVKTN